MKRKVLVHVISNLGVGGAETVLYQLLRRLSSQDFDHKVIYFYEGAYVEKIKQLGIPAYQVKGYFGTYDPLFLFRFFELIQRLRPDCLHTVLWAANFLGRLAAWYYCIPLVQALHNNQDQNGFLRRMIDRLSPTVPGPIVAVSQGVSQSVSTYAPWIDRRKLCVIKNGIDSKEVQKRGVAEMASREELALKKDHFVIGTVGRFEPVKNYSLLLTAFAVLYDKYRKERLVLVGQGSEERFLRQRAYYLGIEQEVVFVTGQPGYRYYPLFDCFVMTSYKEGLSMALLEAMSFGLPCIVTSEESTHDVLIHEKNGLIIKGGEPQLLADTIDRLVQDPELAARLGRAAKETVERSFSIEAMVNGYTDIYRKAMGEAGGPKRFVKGV